jgi:hypothetical protein
MNDVVFIADFFVNQVPGGGELNNEELINILIKRGHKVEKINSHLATTECIENNKNSNFIVANFINLKTSVQSALKDKKYIIYEHDHKYLLNRNPAKYENFLAPSEEIINFDFYKNAAVTICQSEFHENIVEKNLKLDNITNVGGNLWPVEILDFLEEISTKAKKRACSIMVSSIEHKNTAGAIKYCKFKKEKYELIPALSYYSFLERLGANDTLVFLPKTPETLSRIVVESRMMGMKIITNGFVGASKEDWFRLKGKALVDLMRSRREEIPSKIERHFE